MGTSAPPNIQHRPPQRETGSLEKEGLPTPSPQEPGVGLPAPHLIPSQSPGPVGFPTSEQGGEVR